MWPLSYPMAWREGSILDFFLLLLWTCGQFVQKKQKPGYKSIGRQIPVVYVVLWCYVCKTTKQRKNQLKHFVWITEQQKKIFKKKNTFVSRPFGQIL